VPVSRPRERISWPLTTVVIVDMAMRDIKLGEWVETVQYRQASKQAGGQAGSQVVFVAIKARQTTLSWRRVVLGRWLCGNLIMP